MTTQIQTANALQSADNSLQRAFAKKSETPNSLGKDDFLKLLMAQVTHQDPLNPMDSQGMMDQLTGMGSLEQLININDTLGNLNRTQAELMRANSYSFLDKDVKVRGDTLELKQGQAPGLEYQIPGDVEKVRVSILNNEGQVVRNLNLGAQAAGHHNVDWDGRNAQGLPAPDGNYRFRVTAHNGDDQQIPVDLFRQGRVSSVRFEDGQPKLRIGGEDIDLKDVMEMSNRSRHIFGDRLPATLRQDIRTRPPRTERRP